jgi:transcriptional regulator with XRE-family HTH domain
MEAVDMKKLRELRINQGFSQHALSLRANLSAGAVHQIEARGTAQPRTLKAIADVLGVKPMDLMRED